MAQISEIKVTLKSKSIFDKNEQQLEAIIHMDDDYPFMSIKTERWDGLDEKSLEDMCRDTWNWQSKNPKGYEK